MDKCKSFIKRVKPYGYNITCQQPATCEIVARGPDDNVVKHGQYCEKHAKRAIQSYAQPHIGWTVAIEKIEAS